MYGVLSMRIITVIATFLIVAIFLGKRHLAELSVFDFVVAITLGSVAGADVADPEVPHLPTLYAIILIGILHVLLSRTILKNRKIGRWVTLDPTLVVQKGIILRENLKRVRYTVDELLSHLRDKDVFDLREVEYAVLEPSGTLSVLKRPEYNTLKPKDMQLSGESTGLSMPVVLEGKFHDKGLQALNLKREDITLALSKLGYNGPEEVFLCLVNGIGELYVSPNAVPFKMERLDH